MVLIVDLASFPTPIVAYLLLAFAPLHLPDSLKDPDTLVYTSSVCLRVLDTALSSRLQVFQNNPKEGVYKLIELHFF